MGIVVKFCLTLFLSLLLLLFRFVRTILYYKIKVNVFFCYYLRLIFLFCIVQLHRRVAVTIVRLNANFSVTASPSAQSNAGPRIATVLESWHEAPQRRSRKQQARCVYLNHERATRQEHFVVGDVDDVCSCSVLPTLLAGSCPEYEASSMNTGCALY